MDDTEINILKLKFPNSNDEKIVEGVKRLSDALEKMLCHT